MYGKLNFLDKERRVKIWQHIEFAEGNPYICKTEKEFKRMQKKYKLVQMKDGFWKEII